MIAKRVLVWLLSGLIAGACSTAWAQAGGDEEPGGIAKDTERARIEWADHLRYDAEKDTYYLEGKVVFSHKDIKLYCDKATYNYKDDTAHAEGNPRVEDPNTTVTGNYIDVDFGKDLAVIAENVTIVTQKKKPEGEAGAAGQPAVEAQPVAAGAEGTQTAGGETATAEENKPEKLKDYWEKQTIITCDKIEYQYNEDVKIATATSRVKAVQENKTVYADCAVYEEIPGIITLTGDVRILTKSGNEFRCPRAVISTEEDWIQAEGVVGVAKREEKKTEGESQAAPTFGAQPEQPPAENQ